MQKDKLMAIIAGVLGICAIALPAAMDVENDGGTNLIWWAGPFISMELTGFQDIWFVYEEPVLVTLLIPLILVASGMIMTFLTLNPKVHVQFPAILPGILLLAGSASWFLLFAEKDPLFLIWPIPIGVIPGIVAGVVSLVLNIPKMKRAA